MSGAPQIAVDAEQVPRARRLKIVVAHESELVGRGLRDALESHGHQVVLAGASAALPRVDADLAVVSRSAALDGGLNDAALIVLEPELDAVSYVRRYVDGAAGVVNLTDPVDVLVSRQWCVLSGAT